MNDAQLKQSRPSVSVCMATYNGEAYLRKQLNSILMQLGSDDELIVVDDLSKDGTVHIFHELNDVRIKLVQNEQNLGVNKAFEKAISIATKEYIVMTDQDDIWIADRLTSMLEKLYFSGKTVLSSNSLYIDKYENVIDYGSGLLAENQSDQYFQNILRIFLGNAEYYGCCMAFKSSIRHLILPFPNYIESHDLWIAMAANIIRSNYHLEQSTLLRRIHGQNASVLRRPINKKLWSRVIFAMSFFELISRVFIRGISRNRKMYG